MLTPWAVEENSIPGRIPVRIIMKKAKYVKAIIA
jgi:hypothetical protein